MLSIKSKTPNSIFIVILIVVLFLLSRSALAEDSFFSEQETPSNSEAKPEMTKPEVKDETTTQDDLAQGIDKLQETVSKTPGSQPQPVPADAEENNDKPVKAGKKLSPVPLPVLKAEPLVPAAPAHQEADPLDVGKLKEALKKSDVSTQVVYDEGLQPVEISLKDITRIVCPGDITKVVYSKEKGAEVKYEGKEAFFKNLPSESVDPANGRSRLLYDNRPKELYIVCADRTFSLLMVPQDIPTVSVYLKTTHVEKEPAKEFERATDYETLILKLVKNAYKQEVPAGYEVEEVNIQVKDMNELEVSHKNTLKGDMFRVDEYLVYAKKPVRIDELQMLELLELKNPLAVSLIDNILKEKQQTRLFIVRLNNE
jgi:conjugal transfer pilus assembly protein TraK